MSTHRNQIIQTLLLYVENGELNEANWSVCGNNWNTLADLVDQRPKCYGTAAAWICAIAAEWILFEDDRIDVLADDLDEKAQEILGLSNEQWKALEFLPHQRAAELLSHFNQQLQVA